MPRTAFSNALSLVFLFGVSSCGPKPAPAPPAPPAPPPPAPTIEAARVAPEPSVAPGCISLDEECRAKRDESVAFGAASVELPHDWIYARGDGSLVSKSPDGGATLAFTISTGGEADWWPAFEQLFTQLGITGVQRAAVDFEEPTARWPAGVLEVEVWQVEKTSATAQQEDPSLKGEPGALLMGVTRFGEGSAVIALGFLLRSASADLAAPINGAMTRIEPVAEEIE
jgi:hypothetical protein